MRFEAYELYKYEEVLDELGNQTEAMIKVDDIEVNVSERSILETSKDTLYKVKDIVGLTKYRNLNDNIKYLLLKDSKKYNIKTFLHANRFTKLDLEEVVQ